jgi:hypothetical protein
MFHLEFWDACSIVYCLLHFFPPGQIQKHMEHYQDPEGQNSANVILPSKICVKEPLKTMYSQCCFYLSTFRFNLLPLWFLLYICKDIILLYCVHMWVCVCGTRGLCAHVYRCMCLYAHKEPQRISGILFHHSLPSSIDTAGPVTNPGGALWPGGLPQCWS